MKHELKTWKPFFQSVFNGDKDFELRKDDRNYRVGDTLELQEYDAENKSYTGRFCHRTIKYILYGGNFGLESGYVILGLK